MIKILLALLTPILITTADAKSPEDELIFSGGSVNHAAFVSCNENVTKLGAGFNEISTDNGGFTAGATGFRFSVKYKTLNPKYTTNEQAEIEISASRSRFGVMTFPIGQTEYGIDDIYVYIMKEGEKELIRPWLRDTGGRLGDAFKIYFSTNGLEEGIYSLYVCVLPDESFWGWLGGKGQNIAIAKSFEVTNREVKKEVFNGSKNIIKKANAGEDASAPKVDNSQK